MRSGFGTRRPYSSCCRVLRFQLRGRLHPARPVSRLRIAFWKLSCPAHKMSQRCAGRPHSLSHPLSFPFLAHTTHPHPQFHKDEDNP